MFYVLAVHLIFARYWPAHADAPAVLLPPSPVLTSERTTDPITLYGVVVAEPRPRRAAEELAEDLVRRGWHPVRLEPVGRGANAPRAVVFGQFPTRTDALLATHFLEVDPQSRQNPARVRPLKSLTFRPGGTTLQPPTGRASILSIRVLSLNATDTSVTARGTSTTLPGLTALNLNAAMDGQSVRPFGDADGPITQGGIRNGSLMKPADSELASRLQAQTARILGAGKATPEDLELVVTFLTQQKDVRPALPLLEAIALGVVESDAQTRYAATWFLARAHHARADRLSALLVYNQLILASPIANDRAVAWIERAGLLSERLADDGVGTLEDWLAGWIHASWGLDQESAADRRHRLTLDWHFIKNYPYPDNETGRRAMATDLARLMENFSALPRNNGIQWLDRAVLARARLHDSMGENDEALLNYRLLLSLSDLAKQSSISPDIRGEVLARLAALESEAGNYSEALKQSQNLIRAVRHSQENAPKNWLELSLPGRGEPVPGSLRRVMAE
jgi:tetratricopeptide (TPR) repeat protein